MRKEALTDMSIHPVVKEGGERSVCEKEKQKKSASGFGHFFIFYQDYVDGPNPTTLKKKKKKKETV